ncbi:hypothetical protein Sste5346_008988 [Sporothrix stenoceras]|uniref:Uncharacterized protein n=1 Tax=Sporothrix stenoceras TaxID=5173 RepID=A0ABR3YN83_9PEZI
MALWLFKRKSRRKRSSRAGSPTGDISALPRSFTTPSGTAAAGPISSSPIRRRPSSRKQRPEPNKLQRRTRTYSFESGRADDLEIGGTGTWKSSGRRKPSIPSPLHANSGPLNGSFYGSTGPNGAGAAQIDRIPTLHHSNSKRDGRHLLSRTKSSKRRKNAHDRAREAEIKAMSNMNNRNDSNDFTPVRPAAEPWTAGRPMKRETIKTAHPNSFAARYARQKEQLPSDVSLPLAESIDSAMSSDSEQVEFAISPFAALAPRPTLRYASQPRVSVPGGGYYPTRNPSQKHKLAKPIPEATLKAHKRVDDLANDMNASDLRELMERDARRRDRRRVQDKEKAARRLARQAEKHQLQQEYTLSQQASAPGAGPSSERPAASASRSSPDMARGMLGREAVGLGVDTTSAVMTSAVRRESTSIPTPPQRNSIELEDRPQRDIDDPLQGPLSGYSTPSAADQRNSAELAAANSASASASSFRRRSPVDIYHRPDSIPMAPAELELPDAVPDLAETLKESAPVPARTPSKLRRLARLRRRLSSSSSIKEEHESVSKANATVFRKPSNAGSTRARAALTWGSLGALFRWRARSKRTPPGQSSFANLSRDSMAAQSSIQRSHHNFDAVSHGHFRGPSQTLVEEPATVAAAEAAAVMAGPSGSTASVNSSARVTRPPPTKPHPMKVTSLVPKRTLSRFKEDLPDFTMTPPTSRIQSPEVQEAVPPIQAQVIAQQQEVYSATPTQNSSFVHNSADDESIIMTPTGFHQAPQQPSSFDSTSMGNNTMTDGTRDTPTSWLQMEEVDPSPEPQQSLSLASIDSEGSWLSGRTASRRRATQLQPSMDSVSRSFQTKQGHPYQHLEPSVSPTGDELISTAHATMAASGAQKHMDDDESSIVLDDEYLSRLARSSTSGASHGNFQRESTGDMLPSSDDELDTVNGDAGDARWGAVNEKRVDAGFVMSHRTNLVKSREGLMTTFYDGEKGNIMQQEGDSPVDSPISPVSMTSPISQTSSEFNKEEEAGVQRATSVNLGRGHVRHISAGSAKLLEITPSPRNSVDAKANNRSREPLF